MLTLGFPGDSVVKKPPAKQKTWVQPLGQEFPLDNEMATIPVFLPGQPFQYSCLGNPTAKET